MSAPGTVDIARIVVGPGRPLLFIAGPCVIEDGPSTFRVAERLVGVCAKAGLPLVFKASYDKGNRTSAEAFRGPGPEEGLRVLCEVRDRFGVPVTSDVHDVSQVRAAAEVLDILQIPAFLCRQTSLLEAAAATDRVVNVKKGQFLAPWDVDGIIGKVRGGKGLLITERGTTFGYNNLVVDFRAFPMIRERDVPVVYDATHSLQLPGGLGKSSGGMRQYIPHLAKAAVACGIDGLFMEVHPDPDRAPCDGPNMWPLDQLPGLLESLLRVREAAEKGRA